MPVSPRSKRETTSGQPTAPQTDVAAYESRPGRFVFLEDGNTDGWIATDLVMDLSL